MNEQQDHEQFVAFQVPNLDHPQLFLVLKNFFFDTFRPGFHKALAEALNLPKS